MRKGPGRDIYRRLGEKIDGLTARTPWNETFHAILKELYTPEEADIVARMPFTLSSVERISKTTGVEEVRLRNILEGLCSKGLVLDIWNERDNRYCYMPCPLVIGIFEFTMMRTGSGLGTKRWAELFHDYFSSVFPANFSKGEKASILRVIPVEETIRVDAGTEFLDFEKATSIIEDSKRYAIGLCSCRNEKLHIGKKECDAPVEGCSMFGIGADYMIRHGLAREVSKSEMFDNFARSKEHGLVLCAYNTKSSPIAVCHCCKCCCNYLSGLGTFGYTNAVITSNFMATVDEGLCTGCGKCIKACPMNAASLLPLDDSPGAKKKKKARVNRNICIGCGVCSMKCPSQAVRMVRREKRTIPPETLFEATLLAALERGNLQNQLFDNPQSVTQEFMRTFVGAFLRLEPVKKALLSDMLRSSFLSFMKKGAALQGKGWITEL
ncbi:MAG TPA: 4Fe-4S binding protein [Deltaproteobacteria bacterium]|nr:4Fe-4S binding protein [Deltaproteobacteria bacterium]HQI00583.1 4Fe-4S binding protein [Deltaproteobacteria bacterium]